MADLRFDGFLFAQSAVCLKAWDGIPKSRERDKARLPKKS